MVLHDLSSCSTSIKNGTYGGMAGYKEGIIYMSDKWLIKYPKNISHIKKEDRVYSTSPVSEYIGSHIFEILGIPVHDTLLGYRNGKLVVACRDFLKKDETLLEVRTLKNLMNRDKEILFDRQFGSTSPSYVVDLEELLLHLNHNPILSVVPGIFERFVEQAIVDIAVNNNDRNNGNWGIIRVGSYDTWTDCIAPVFDNGNSFSCNLTDAEVRKRLGNISEARKSACNTIVVYGENDKHFTAREFCKMIPTFEVSSEFILMCIDNIKYHLKDMVDFIMNIPTYENMGSTRVDIISEARKELYALQLTERVNVLLCKELYDACKTKSCAQVQSNLCDCSDIM